MRRERYCYWSLVAGAQHARMERCVRSARDNGVSKSFHVLTDAPIAGCESYDRMELADQAGFEPLIYLRAGISKLLFDYFVWIDPSTMFTSNPDDLLGALGKSPLHVPFEAELSAVGDEGYINKLAAPEYCRAMRNRGVTGEVYASGSAFWIIRNEAIDYVCALASEIHLADKRLNLASALGYVMHMICANTGAHHFARRPDLWAADHAGALDEDALQGKPWNHVCPWTGESRLVRPSIVHLPISARPATMVARGAAQLHAESTL